MGDVKRIAHRYTQSTTGQWVGAVVVEKQRIPAHRRHVPCDGTDVHRVVHVVGEHSESKALEEFICAVGFGSLEQRDHFEWNSQSGDVTTQFFRGIERVTLVVGRKLGESSCALLTAQHRNGFAAGGQGSLGNQITFCDEEWTAVSSLDDAHQATFAKAKRIQSRVVEVGDF